MVVRPRAEQEPDAGTDGERAEGGDGHDGGSTETLEAIHSL